MSEAAAKSANQAVSSSRARAAPQRGRAPSGPGSVSAAIAKLHAIGGNRAVHALLGGGAPLPSATQDEFGRRFGTDFSSVRIHDDAAAHGSAADLDAKAYAVGERVVFSAGRYDIHSGAGKRLLAHELAHVIQQRRGGGTPTLAPSGAHERGADAAAHAFVSGPGPVAVQGAAGVGVARAPEDKPHADFYLTAFLANRAWFWGSVGATPEGWPDDEKLASLWQSLGVSTQKGKVGPSDDNVMAHRQEFTEFADMVRAYQRDKMNRKDNSANGVVDPATANALRKDPITPPKEKEAAKVKGQDFIATTSSHKTAIRGSKVTNVTQDAASSDSLGMIGDRVVDEIAGQIAGGEGLQQRMIAAAMRGFIAEMQTQLVDEEKAKHARDHMMELLNPKVGAAYGASYLAGLIPGFLSPVTDLFGIPAFVDSASDFVQGVEKKIAGQALELANEGSEIRKKLAALKTEFTKAATDIFRDLAKDPKQIFTLIGQATDTASNMAVNMAARMGHATAAEVIHLFESPWEEEKDEDPGWGSVLPKDPLSLSTALNPTWAATATASRAWEYGTERLKKKIFSSPWSQVGYAIGHAMGALLANLLLLVFTDGIGDAIAAIGKGLSEIAPALRALETIAVKIAEALKFIGGAIKAVEEGIAAVASTILKPLEKVLKPFEELLGSLKLWLQKCLGVVEKDPEALAEAGVKVLKLKQPPKVEPRLTGGSTVADDATKVGSKLESTATPQVKPKVDADSHVDPLKNKPDTKPKLPTQDDPNVTKDPTANRKPGKNPDPQQKPDVTKGDLDPKKDPTKQPDPQTRPKVSDDEPEPGRRKDKGDTRRQRRKSGDDEPGEAGERQEKRKRDKEAKERRDRERARAGKDESQIAAERSARELRRLEDSARDPGAKFRSRRTKEKDLRRFEDVQKDAPGSNLQKNRRKGAFHESQSTPTKVAGKPQEKWVAGGQELPFQDLPAGEAKYAQPDYSVWRRGPDGKFERVHVNLKSDKVHMKTPAEARATAKYNTDQAIRNSRHLPGDEGIVIDYAHTPPKDIQDIMLKEHFREGSPITEVRFGTTTYRQGDYKPPATGPSATPKPRKPPKKRRGKK